MTDTALNLSEKEEIARRFWSKVDKSAGPDGCWPWTGSLNLQGYGRVCVRGKRHPAAQMAWSLHHGLPFPEGKGACHTCDNPPCVNPAHIWPGTQSENLTDASQKGRTLGRRNQNSSKTHCPRGHPLSGANLVQSALRFGRRACLTCQRAWQREYERTRRCRPVKAPQEHRA